MSIRNDLPDKDLTEGRSDSGCSESLFAQYASLIEYPNADYVFSNFHAGPGQISFGPNCRRKADCLISEVGGEKSASVLNYINYHGLYYHRAGLHLEDCPKNNLFEQSHFFTLESKIADWAERKDLDEMKKEYASALSAVHPDQLVIKYRIVHECDLQHKKLVFNNVPGVGAREILLEHFNEQSVINNNCAPRKMTQDELVELILKGGYNRNGNTLGGFVTILGGEETNQDLPLNGQFGFCHQRNLISADRVGPFTHFQDSILTNKTSDSVLNKACKNGYTFSAKQFHEEGETLSLDYFRFLIKERGLKNFKITHFLKYEHRHFLTPFLEALLQKRHDLKADIDEAKGILMRGDRVGKELAEKVIKSKTCESDTNKLIGNSFYGFMSMEASNYSKTEIISEKTLKRMSNRDRLLKIWGPNVFKVNLLGTTVSKLKKRRNRKWNKKTKKMETDREGEEIDEREEVNFLYAVSSHDNEAAINNVLPISVCILGQSKLVLFEAVLALHKCLDERKCQLCYIDTDSYILAVSDTNLDNLVKKGMEETWQKLSSSLFEDKNSPKEQSGLLKLEATFNNAMFRSSKAYYLYNSSDEEVTRLRSIQTKMISSLDKKKTFGQDPLINAPVVRSVNMKPTSGSQIVMLDQSRSIPHCLNLKRKATVNSIFLFITKLKLHF